MLAPLVVLVVSGAATALAASPASRGGTISQESCPTTSPNGRPPGRVDDRDFDTHGNHLLAAILRRDGTVVANRAGGYKMLWYARKGLAGQLVVRYRRINEPSGPLTARSGYFSGRYGEPNSTMSQMSFVPGCWQITGRVRKVQLRFVVWVVLNER